MGRISLAAFACASALVSSCSSTVPTTSPRPDAGAPPPSISDGLPDACSPLRVPGFCMLPWPNAIDLDADPTTTTGLRVHLTPSTLPSPATTHTPLDTTRWNMADGFSPAGPMLVYFADEIDAASLVPENDIGRSLDADAATVLVDMKTHTRVAHFSGVDENATRTTDHQAVILTPAARLLPDRRYAVAITRTIRTTGGKVPASPPTFEAIVSGNPPHDARSRAEAARMPDILAALEAAGVKRTDLVLAWDFVTGSDEALTGHVLSMRDQALATLPKALGYTVTGVDENLDAEVLRRVRGTFSAPRFLDNEDESKPEAELTFDGKGKPVLNGTYQAPFTVIVPAVAATKGPLPVIVYGHGFLGNGEEELGGASGSALQDFAQREGYVLVATDWIGLSSHEDPVDPGSNDALSYALADLSKLPWITDRLQQAIVSTVVLERTMAERIVNDPSMTVTGAAGGKPVADPTKVTYYGISLGAIMGLSFMGYDPDVTRGALGSGGGFWSSLFQRSVNWKLAALLAAGDYPDALDVQLLFALMQMQFDYSDPATVAPHVLMDPLPGVPKKALLAQMGLDDAEVPNIASEMIARTVGLPLLEPDVTSPFGLTPTKGPLPSALTTWHVNAPPAPPDTNQTPDHDNQVHEAVRRIPQAEDQIRTFFSTGKVVDTCGGKPCNEPIPPSTPPVCSFCSTPGGHVP